MAIADYLEPRVAARHPVNIHLTGCHHSCAQHYIGDIGLLGARVPVDAGRRHGRRLPRLVGGGFGADAGIGRELYPRREGRGLPAAVERILKAYVAQSRRPRRRLPGFHAAP